MGSISCKLWEKWGQNNQEDTPGFQWDRELKLSGHTNLAELWLNSLFLAQTGSVPEVFHNIDREIQECNDDNSSIAFQPDLDAVVNKFFRIIIANPYVVIYMLRGAQEKAPERTLEILSGTQIREHSSGQRQGRVKNIPATIDLDQSVLAFQECG